MTNFVGRGFYLALGLGAIGGAALLFRPAPEPQPTAQATPVVTAMSEKPSAAAPRTDAAEGTVAALRTGTMKKLQFHSEPKPVSASAFIDETGAEMTLGDYQGKHILLNFWATWCAPCRKEMPMLSELQAEFGGDTFEVVTISTGRGNPMALKQFFNEIGVDNLPEHRDPNQDLARDMGVLGLPITLIVDPEGNEIARMQGDADWAGPSAKAIIAGVLNDQPLQ